MRLGRIGTAGHEVPVLMENDILLDLRSLTTEIDGEFLAADGIARVREARAANALYQISSTDGVRVAAPIARPQTVYCIGMNYAAHAAESGSQPPEAPIVFLKPPNTVVGPFDDVPIPRGSSKTDWEVELAVIIGRRALYLDSPSDSANHIAGFTVANDLSERSWQIETSGGQWSKGKAAPGFCPLGPWLVTPDEADVRDLRLTSTVNGAARQDSSTTDLIFRVPFLVWHLSQYLALEPGDVILTGTPQGVALSGRFPYLQEGDVVDLEIAGIGRQRQQMVNWERQG